MALTFVSYKGRDVEVPESTLICLGYMLFHEGRVHAATPNEGVRFEQMANEFADRTVGVGCADLALDVILEGKAEKEAEFLTLIRYVRDRLQGCGGRLPVEYIDEVIAVREPDYRGKSLESPWFAKVLDAIEVVISGQVGGCD